MYRVKSLSSIKKTSSWNFWVKEASGEVGIYTSEKLAPQNIGIAIEIV